MRNSSSIRVSQMNKWKAGTSVERKFVKSFLWFLKIRTAFCLRTFLAEGNGVYFKQILSFLFEYWEQLTLWSSILSIFAFLDLIRCCHTLHKPDTGSRKHPGIAVFRCTRLIWYICLVHDVTPQLALSSVLNLVLMGLGWLLLNLSKTKVMVTGSGKD